MGSRVRVPYAPLLKKVKKSLITLIIKDFFFYALHETKIANSYSLRLRLTDILNILLPAIGHQTYKVIYKKDNNSLHHLGYSILNSTFAYIKKIE
ncbi:hypothetical protein DW108_25075 [Bacteroides thetaiotaomicron]|nr:hypothetical protein DW108_25075 [Bacteroides thetaiotaomicron]